MSSARAGSSGSGTPPSSRDRKAARPPKRQPPGYAGGAPRARCDEPAPAELLRAIDEFNAGRLFEQHETLELLWRATADPGRELYHGILQLGVGLYHWQRGNHHGATVLLGEGLARLGPFAPRCRGIDVADLLRQGSDALGRLGALGPEHLREVDPAGLVRIRMA